jgi:hypothetical protein
MNEKLFPFQVSEPRKMTILEQVFCMVYLATSKTLKELRRYQSLVEKQFILATQNNCGEKSFKNLEAMQHCYDAAVAYQQFDDDFWLAFIDTSDRT